MLHLKRGEALGYIGKRDEAQKQFVLAPVSISPPPTRPLSQET